MSLRRSRGDPQTRMPDRNDSQSSVQEILTPACPFDKTLGRAGRPFVQFVLEALDANRITAVEASRYLDLRFDHIEKLRGELTISAGTAVDDGD